MEFFRGDRRREWQKDGDSAEEAPEYEWVPPVAPGKRPRTAALARAGAGRLRASSESVGGNAVARRGLTGPAAPFPHADVLERAFGQPLGARAFLGPDAARAAGQLGARAYALGDSVAFASAAPDLHTAAHEAAHVLQGSAGVSPAANAATGGDLERHADAAAALVVSGRSAAHLFGGPAAAPAVRRKPTGEALFGPGSIGDHRPTFKLRIKETIGKTDLRLVILIRGLPPGSDERHVRVGLMPEAILSKESQEKLKSKIRTTFLKVEGPWSPVDGMPVTITPMASFRATDGTPEVTYGLKVAGDLTPWAREHGYIMKDGIQVLIEGTVQRTVKPKARNQNADASGDADRSEAKEPEGRADRPSVNGEAPAPVTEEAPPALSPGEALGADGGDLVASGAEDAGMVKRSLGALRQLLGEARGLLGRTLESLNKCVSLVEDLVARGLSCLAGELAELFFDVIAPLAALGFAIADLIHAIWEGFKLFGGHHGHGGGKASGSHGKAAGRRGQARAGADRPSGAPGTATGSGGDQTSAATSGAAVHGNATVGAAAREMMSLLRAARDEVASALARLPESPASPAGEQDATTTQAEEHAAKKHGVEPHTSHHATTHHPAKHHATTHHPAKHHATTHHPAKHHATTHHPAKHHATTHHPAKHHATTHHKAHHHHKARHDHDRSSEPHDGGIRRVLPPDWVTRWDRDTLLLDQHNVNRIVHVIPMRAPDGAVGRIAAVRLHVGSRRVGDMVPFRLEIDLELPGGGTETLVQHHAFEPPRAGSTRGHYFAPQHDDRLGHGIRAHLEAPPGQAVQSAPQASIAARGCILTITQVEDSHPPVESKEGTFHSLVVTLMPSHVHGTPELVDDLWSVHHVVVGKPIRFHLQWMDRAHTSAHR